ncbi:Ion transport 2 domain-containing protein [Lysobacter dokdonensis DS-58]|uniref:Ion transport 2 domain-containing protein n=1 Tax=Lysobacter dokdonensis DS-58 TaxID=1300345 RepID=A0A0A2WMT4_9GAMM|nr:potassium channel family protein [Lysobacter dokdonensis]KGQ20042.1 Ion transport 2 domain-containing protein [Lysobacter dokdonensis DS-58]
MRRALADTVQWWGRNRHAILFALLIATIAMGPLLSVTGSGGWLLNASLGLTLLAAAVAPTRDRVRRRGLLVLAVAAIVLGLAPIRTGFGETGPLTLALWSAIAFVAATRSFRYAMSSARVDREHLLAGLNTYLLVGVFFGAIWVAMEKAMPRSLLLGGAPIDAMVLPDGIYFSFVTLASLGYGDFTPATPIARGLAVFEVVFGQLYLAIMVARLVSLRIAVLARDDPP